MEYIKPKKIAKLDKNSERSVRKNQTQNSQKVTFYS